MACGAGLCPPFPAPLCFLSFLALSLRSLRPAGICGFVYEGSTVMVGLTRSDNEATFASGYPTLSATSGKQLTRGAAFAKFAGSRIRSADRTT